MAFTKNRSASRFLNKWIRATKFLETMEKVIPWEELVDVIDEKRDETDVSKWWRPRVSTEIMLRMYFLSQWFNLSDVLTEETIYDRLSFQYFMNIDVTSDQIPDSTTLCWFRHFLEEKELWKEILTVVNEQLKKAEIIMTWWSLVDATIIKAPSSTKNKNNKRDPEMSSTKKRGNRSFGAKVHIWTDENGYIKEMQTTTAKTHDSQVYDDLVSEEDDYSLGDAAYIWEDIENAAAEKWIEHYAMKKRKRWQKRLATTERLWNTLLSMPRKVVEFPFWVVKNLWWHRKTRYRWLEKLKNQRYTLSALCNMYRARHKIQKRRFW